MNRPDIEAIRRKSERWLDGNPFVYRWWIDDLNALLSYVADLERRLERIQTTRLACDECEQTMCECLSESFKNMERQVREAKTEALEEMADKLWASRTEQLSRGSLVGPLIAMLRTEAESLRSASEGGGA